LAKEFLPAQKGRRWYDNDRRTMFMNFLPGTSSGWNSKYFAGLFAASRRGRALKGSKHSCGSSTPPDDKNPHRHTLKPSLMRHQYFYL